jgi:alpha-D-ribose 1-methylphosphonate 5-triphosphate synthase subunit PhnG
MSNDEVLSECTNDSLVQFITNIEPGLDIQMVIAPKLCMTMVQAEDSIDFQPFYLGEVLITECQLTVNGELGYGFCMGDAPQRAYSMAIIDAILHKPEHPLQTEIHLFVEKEKAILTKSRLEEYNQILKTKVDFKIMEQD